jgi:glycosyltransferase involved in cell wall biosynthesis
MQNSFDIMHVFVGWQPPSLSSTIAAKFKRIFCNSYRKIIIDWDDLWGNNGISKEHTFIIRFLINFFEIKVLSLADHITVCSSFLRDIAVKNTLIKVSILYNGSNSNEIYPLSKIDSRLLLGIKRNIKIGLLIGQFQTSVFPKIIDNFEYIFSKRNDLYFYIIGSIPSAYLDKINNSNGRIIFLGKVPYADLKYYFSSADFLVMAMDETDIERARFPIRFGDYIASGTPILASPVGEIYNLILDNDIAVIANINSKFDYESKINTILDQSIFSSIIANNARIFSLESLSWTVLTNKLLDIYE